MGPKISSNDFCLWLRKFMDEEALHLSATDRIARIKEELNKVESKVKQNVTVHNQSLVKVHPFVRPIDVRF